MKSNVMARWIVALLLLASSAPVSAEVLEEAWYVVRFQGQRAGWMHGVVTADDEGITSTSDMQIVIARGPARVEIGMKSSFTETRAGKPLRASSVQKLATQVMEKAIAFHDDRLEITTKQFGQSFTQKLPSVGTDWLPPYAAQRHVAKKTGEGDKVVRFRTFEPTTATEPFEVTVETIGPADVEVFGRVAPAIQRTVVMSILPGVKTVEYADESGRPLRSTIDMGGIQMDLLAADKQLAMAQVDPPELLMATLVKPEFALLKPRQMRKASYELEVSTGSMPELPSSAVQRIKRLDDKRLAVTIDLDAAAEREAAPPVVHNAMINGVDEKVAALTAKALKEAEQQTAAEKAEALRRYAHGYIRVANLSVGMASASEVARTRVGDCTEYATLLAGMLKAAGIPARMASGLIYVTAFGEADNVFGYHAWTQAHIDGRWVDLDATLDHRTPFDAAHILLSTSDLNDSAITNDLVTLMPLMGNLKIRLAK